MDYRRDKESLVSDLPDLAHSDVTLLPQLIDKKGTFRPGKAIFTIRSSTTRYCIGPRQGEMALLLVGNEEQVSGAPGVTRHFLITLKR